MLGSGSTPTPTSPVINGRADFIGVSYVPHGEAKVGVELVPYNFLYKYKLGFGFRSYPKVCGHSAAFIGATIGSLLFARALATDWISSVPLMAHPSSGEQLRTCA